MTSVEDQLDPFAWLESSDIAVGEWQRSENEAAVTAIHALPQLTAMAAHVEATYVGRPPTVPLHVAGQWWWIEDQQRVFRSTVPFVAGELVVACQTLDPGNDAAVLSWVSPAPDGAHVAVGLCRDGSEHNTIAVLEVATGARLVGPPQLLFDAWAGGAVWLPDARSFLFIALAPDDDPRWMALYHHAIGEEPPILPESIGDGLDAFLDYLHVSISRDGRWAVLSRRLAAPIPFAMRRLDEAGSSWHAFVTRDDCGITGHVLGDGYVAVTDLDAPRGRLVEIPLNAADPNDHTCWRELVPEGTSVLRTVTPVEEHLYLSEFVDTYSQIRVVDRSGQYTQTVPLPGRGAISEPHFPLLTLVPRGHPNELVFAFSTLTTSWGTYRHRPGSVVLDVLQVPRVVLEGATVEDRFACSVDGTLVPYHVVRPPDSERRPLPALLWGYGGFNIPNVAQFPGAMAAFVAAGGLFVHTHLRGGAEYGRDWWHGGRGFHKQRTFDDLYAIAEDLIAHGDTTAAQLAVTGGSNGGLLCGVAATQRPELFRAVVPQVPILDLAGAMRDPYGQATVREYADIDEVAEVQRMLTFSPYHLAQREAEYPAILVVAGETDPRCPAWHARKWVARLRQAQRGGAPVLLRVWEGSGHGLATAPATVREQAAEWLAFVAHQVGL